MYNSAERPSEKCNETAVAVNVRRDGGVYMGVERELFETFFRQHHLAACRFACALVGGAEAEDAVQEAFVRLHLRQRRLPAVENPEAFFYRILYNVCRTLLRRRRVRAALAGWLGRPEPPRPGAGLELSQAWRILSPRERAIFYLMDFRGWDMAAVAAALGMRPATVRVHRHRLRSKIVNWEAES